MIQAIAQAVAVEGYVVADEDGGIWIELLVLSVGAQLGEPVGSLVFGEFVKLCENGGRIVKEGTVHVSLDFCMNWPNHKSENQSCAVADYGTL